MEFKDMEFVATFAMLVSATVMVSVKPRESGCIRRFAWGASKGDQDVKGLAE